MHVLWRGSTLQRIRLGSGLVLFAFAATHFFNHALGLVSLDAMQAFDGWRTTVTRSFIGTAILLSALCAHAGLALWKFAHRRTLKLPAWELCQLGLGLAIPLFLLPHIVSTRISSFLFGVDTTYAYVLARVWPATMIQQTALLLIVWVHGCIGLHYWLRLTPSYRRVAPLLLGAAVILPFAALSGVMVQGRMLAAATADTIRFATLKAATRWPDPVADARIVDLRYLATGVFYAIAAVAFGILGGRLVLRRRARSLAVQYVDGPTVKTAPGPTLLEVSRAHGIPHMSICGGRGRCSTCRVLVLIGQSGLDPAADAEIKTLKAIRAPANVRLACQARPKADLTIMQLFKAEPATSSLLASGEFGVERDLAVLFVDIRGFTALAESRLAYDVVFLLNQFFGVVGRPIYDMGGWINDYAGDGLLAVFADPRGIDGACRSALLAAAEIDRAVEIMNARLASEIQQSLRIAMGLHAGHHVVGRLGFGDRQSPSVVGPAVNIASRLETLAKATGMQLAVSEMVALRAGLDVTHLRVETAEIRGSRTPMRVVFVDSARSLAERLRAPAVSEPT